MVNMGRPVSSVELESWLKAAPELRSLPKRMGIMQALPFCLKRFCRFTVFISPHTLHPLDKPAQFLSYFLKMFVLFIDLAALVSVEAHRNFSAGKMIFSFSL